MLWNQGESNVIRMAALPSADKRFPHTTPKSIRGRLPSYRSDQALRTGSRTFTIPFDRQQLAGYLNVDRASLSSELGKLQREGVLRTKRSRFELLGGKENEGIFNDFYLKNS